MREFHSLKTIGTVSDTHICYAKLIGYGGSGKRQKPTAQRLVGAERPKTLCPIIIRFSLICSGHELIGWFSTRPQSVKVPTQFSKKPRVLGDKTI
jgi:hypothetical protein